MQKKNIQLADIVPRGGGASPDVLLFKVLFNSFENLHIKKKVYFNNCALLDV